MNLDDLERKTLNFRKNLFGDKIFWMVRENQSEFRLQIHLNSKRKRRYSKIWERILLKSLNIRKYFEYILNSSKFRKGVLPDFDNKRFWFLRRECLEEFSSRVSGEILTIPSGISYKFRKVNYPTAERKFLEDFGKKNVNWKNSVRNTRRTSRRNPRKKHLRVLLEDSNIFPEKNLEKISKWSSVITSGVLPVVLSGFFLKKFFWYSSNFRLFWDLPIFSCTITLRFCYSLFSAILYLILGFISFCWDFSRCSFFKEFLLESPNNVEHFSGRSAWNMFITASGCFSRSNFRNLRRIYSKNTRRIYPRI